MKFNYIVQDEYEVLDENIEPGKLKYKDPIEISIKITVERTRYNSVINRRKTPLPQIIKELFRPCK